jgi:hypothetical protein
MALHAVGAGVTASFYSQGPLLYTPLPLAPVTSRDGR